MISQPQQGLEVGEPVPAVATTQAMEASGTPGPEGVVERVVEQEVKKLARRAELM